MVAYGATMAVFGSKSRTECAGRENSRPGRVGKERLYAAEVQQQIVNRPDNPVKHVFSQARPRFRSFAKILRT